jgi:TM2 domain-containing membrane protein YozV
VFLFGSGSARLGETFMKNPGTAAVLSFIIPGVGQIYNGQRCDSVQSKLSRGIIE